MTDSSSDAVAFKARLLDMELAAVRQLCWYPSEMSISDSEITLSGWALDIWRDQDQYRFLVDGSDFDEVRWPLPSPDVQKVFPNTPYSSSARFYCRHHLKGKPSTDNGFTRFNVTGPYGETALSYRTAWSMSNPAKELVLPSPAQRVRVVGNSDAKAYQTSGATLACRFDAYLLHRFGRPASSFASVLDWGCGSGRLTRYLTRLYSNVTGVDVDQDTVAACAATIPSAKFLGIDLNPPIPCPNHSFDLLIGVSVFTHLDDLAQHTWLAELKRVARPGALLLMTIAGQAQVFLYGDHGQDQYQSQRLGLHVLGENPQLDGVLPDPGYYKDVRHSHEYVLKEWSRYFDVIEIVPGLACGQDVAVLMARG